ncbi:triggering receptor expressed on myeloid cells 1 [Nycticebus coucang]|uniref:triggering receptor expressed on myeloid cells 1 n=1 Tax=Nycticebus coucang TaxID=9470 RepID=UPI00234DF1EB|nr:triggering receptor expressed on myeloid cells 1 [Nycticebus coucang]
MPGARSSSWNRCTRRMGTARLWRLLWVLIVSELQGTAESCDLEECVLAEGETLNVRCPFNIRKHANSRKAWQRLRDGEEPLTLAVTESTSGDPSEVRTGKVTLEDIPHEAMLLVRMANLQVEDSGLYRCVIYSPPKDPEILYHPVHLVVAKDLLSTLAPKKKPIQNLSPTNTVPPTTTKASSPQRTPEFTISTSDPTVNLQNVTRVPVFSIVVPVVCGLLSKSLVFTVLLAVTQKSFGF